MEGFFQFQIAVNLFFQHLGDFFLILSRTFSLLGDEYFYFLFMPFLYWCVDSAMGIRIGAMLLISNGVISGIKSLFHWPRPYWFDAQVRGYVTENSFGFPSGHSANAASVWTVFAAHIRKNWLWVVVIFTIVMIGISRLALGVHFLVDVLGGWLIGFLLAAIFLRYEKTISRWFSDLQYRQQWIVVFISSIFILLPGFFFSWLFKDYILPEAWSSNAGNILTPFDPSGVFTAGGTWAGFLGGFIWFKHHFGKLNMDIKPSSNLLRYVLGIIGVVVFWKGLDMIFPDSSDAMGLVFRYFRYFLTGFWIAGLAPYVFTRINGSLKEPENTLQ